MKVKFLIPIVAAIALPALIRGYAQTHEGREADEGGDRPITAAARVRTGANGETIITLDLKAQQLIGLRTAALAAATLPPEVKAWGRVLDSAPLISFHDNVVAARAELRASRLEYERLKRLSAQDNASAHARETAEARMKQDQSALATAEAQLAAASGQAALSAPSGFFQALTKQESVLVRLDVPAGESVATAPGAAQLIVPGMDQPVPAAFLGRAATTDPQTQGEGFLFLVTNAPALLTPGLAVTGSLQLSGEPLQGVIVPNSAVVRSDQRAWIYLQAASTDFARREILLDHPMAGGWFVANRLAPGDKVVVIGAQTLLSEERKGQIKLED